MPPPESGRASGPETRQGRADDLLTGRRPEAEQEQGSLAAAAATLNLDLPASTLQRLLAYRDLIAKWNRVYNLTAVRDPGEMRVQHLHDSLALVGPLRRHTQGQAARVLDVGSGAGLPGVVLAIACPELAVTCVDTVAKKAAFIQQAALELRLPNLSARHARVEDLPGPGYDLITSRAFASLADFVALTRRLLAPAGVWVGMKGVTPAEEIAALKGVDTFHVEPIEVPDLAAQRCLVWMRPA